MKTLIQLSPQPEQLQQVQDFLSKAVNSLTQSAQPTVDTINQTINQTVDAITARAGQFQSTTTETLQTAVSSTISDWLVAHPVALKLVQILIWGINHPIWGLIILLLVIAIAWSLVKAVGRLIETTILALLKAPFQLILNLIQVGFKSLIRFKGLNFKQLKADKTSQVLTLPDSTYYLQPDQRQRLIEISARLEAIRLEQEQLLQELAAILKLKNIQH